MKIIVSQLEYGIFWGKIILNMKEAIAIDIKHYKLRNMKEIEIDIKHY